MIRATTGGVLKSYRSNLMSSFTSLNKARDTVLSQRVFNSYAEDPATAAKAFKLRKSRMAVQSQHDICNDTYKKYQTAWSCLDTVDKLIDTDTSSMNTLKGTTLKALNDSTGDAREQLTTALDQISESIIQTMNQKYGDSFIFAGADGHNVPFEVRDVGGQNKLFYRGVPVDAAVPKNPADMTTDEYNKACDDAEKLKYLANEKYFVDIGLGFQENGKGELIESSGYNSSLVGLNFIGYGVDEDGDPKNIYSIVQKLKDIAGRVKDGYDWTEDDYNEFDGLVGKLERASSEFKTAYTNMDAGTTKLKNNLALLEDNFYNLQEQYSDLEDVDMADSITAFVWAQYCYNAALKVGNSVLSESLMDYLS